MAFKKCDFSGKRFTATGINIGPLFLEELHCWYPVSKKDDSLDIEFRQCRFTDAVTIHTIMAKSKRICLDDITCHDGDNHFGWWNGVTVLSIAKGIQDSPYLHTVRLRKVPFLPPGSIQNFIRMLPRCRSLCHLSFEDTELNLKAWNQLCTVAVNCRGLQRLYLIRTQPPDIHRKQSETISRGIVLYNLLSTKENLYDVKYTISEVSMAMHELISAEVTRKKVLQSLALLECSEQSDALHIPVIARLCIEHIWHVDVLFHLLRHNTANPLEVLKEMCVCANRKMCPSDDGTAAALLGAYRGH